MEPVISKKKALKPVTLRLEQDAYDKVKQIAKEKSSNESDVYRSAIDFFLANYTTSRSK
jgi:predicted transcriptional regulator